MTISLGATAIGAPFSTALATQNTTLSGPASPKAIVVMVAQWGGSTNEIQSIKYAGLTMSLIASIADTTEAGWVGIYALTSASIPAAGTQTIAMLTASGGTSTKYLVGMSFIADYSMSVVGTGNTSSSASAVNPALILTGLTPGTPYACAEVIHSGLNTITNTPQTTPAWNLIQAVDTGTRGEGFAYLINTPVGNTIDGGWIAATADDYAMAGIALKENVPVGPAPTDYWGVAA